MHANRQRFTPFAVSRSFFMQIKVNVSGSAFYSMSEAPPVLNAFDRQLSAKSKVLIFSREPDMRILLKTLLELWGFQTTESDCLETSLSIVENEKPSLILVDSILPFETHLENIRQLKRHKFAGEIPIIVLSGFSQPQFKDLSMAVGADGFFVKPLDFDQLETYLKKNLEKRVEKLH